jgi:hypothetical protein
MLTLACSLCAAEESWRTTLSSPETKYSVSDRPYVLLKRGDVEVVIVDNSAVDDETLPGHRAGYSGIGALRHARQRRNLFVPEVSGLNYEHIHDGTKQDRKILFEPRHAPVQLRLIDDQTAELYQAPTPHWKLESCVRYELLPDGVIEMTLECCPRAKIFANSYIGLFFASYIQKPESLDIHFLGQPRPRVTSRPSEPIPATSPTGHEPGWIRGVTPAHGRLSTHLAIDDRRDFTHDPEFPLTLVFNLSDYCYAEPWYYGVSHGMAMVQMFREQDQVRFSQSPSGGGEGCPAWDFQWFIPRYEVGQTYRFVMRAAYLPFESPEQIVRATVPHRAALNPRSLAPPTR